VKVWVEWGVDGLERFVRAWLERQSSFGGGRSLASDGGGG
jgi:hypothetical protein